MVKLDNIKNIFFDLGGVLLNIDFKKTHDAFAALGIADAYDLNSRPEVLQLFLDLECGGYDEGAFLKQFRELLDLGTYPPQPPLDKGGEIPARDEGNSPSSSEEGAGGWIPSSPINDAQLIDAFNALLLDFPPERIAKVQEVTKKYRCFLLSNTNAIHAECYNNRLKENFGIESLDHLLEKAFYSHDLGFRKPDKRIYLSAIEKAGVKPEESLFIDDLAENIEAARAVGMKAVQVDEEYTILDVFNGSPLSRG